MAMHLMVLQMDTLTDMQMETRMAIQTNMPMDMQKETASVAMLPAQMGMQLTKPLMEAMLLMGNMQTSLLTMGTAMDMMMQQAAKALSKR